MNATDGYVVQIVREPGNAGVAYSEGKRSFVLPLFPGSRHLPVPGATLWREVMPPFVRDRREQVLPRLLRSCGEGGLIAIDAGKREQIGRILYIETEPYRIEYYGNPRNPAYTGEAEAVYEDSRQTV